MVYTEFVAIFFYTPTVRLADSGKTWVGDIRVRNSIFVTMIKHIIWILKWKNYPYALINQSQVNNVQTTSN